MKKLAMIMAVAVMVFTAASGEAQNSAKQRKPVRFFCVVGVGEETEALFEFMRWEECTLLNSYELYQGYRKTLTDNGIWGKAMVEFVSEEITDKGRIVLWFTDDAISRQAGYTYKVPFASSRTTGLKAGQKVIIYYSAQVSDEKLDTMLVFVEVP